MPAIPVLAAMEVSGVVFLPERVTRFSEALGRHLDGLRRTARTAAGGRDFNLASPDQVGGKAGGGRTLVLHILGVRPSNRRPREDGNLSLSE